MSDAESKSSPLEQMYRDVRAATTLTAVSETK
jgi:hypothetical protein